MIATSEIRITVLVDKKDVESIECCTTVCRTAGIKKGLSLMIKARQQSSLTRPVWKDIAEGKGVI